MLAVENLEVRYGGITALRGVSLEVAEGETVLLVGANGAGKSSLINAVIGLAATSRGRVRFAGEDISALPCDGRARAGMGYSPEGRRVFATMTVKDNVLSGACGRGASANARRGNGSVVSFRCSGSAQLSRLDNYPAANSKSSPLRAR